MMVQPQFANVGAGTGIYKETTSANTKAFKSLSNGAGINFVVTADNIEIHATATPGPTQMKWQEIIYFPALTERTFAGVWGWGGDERFDGRSWGTSAPTSGLLGITRPHPKFIGGNIEVSVFGGHRGTAGGYTGTANVKACWAANNDDGATMAWGSDVAINWTVTAGDNKLWRSNNASVAPGQSYSDLDLLCIHVSRTDANAEPLVASGLRIRYTIDLGT